MDGFPRTIPQAISLKGILSGLGREINHVISLDVDNAEIIQRLSGRRTCSVCGKGYHVTYDPPKSEGVCDACGGALNQREDDKEATIKNRLSIYDQQTAPLKDYYDQAGLLRHINGCGTIRNIQQQIDKLLSGQSGDHS